MKIAKLETIRVAEFPNLLWLRVHTRRGPRRARRDLLRAAHGRGLRPRGGRREGCSAAIRWRSTASPKTSSAISASARRGVEMRGNSALDIALWDLFGKATGQPIAQLLGGFSRPTIRTYNTCAGAAYMRESERPAHGELGPAGRSARPLRRSRRLPATAPTNWREICSREGITAMKIWPFDPAAEQSDGTISRAADLKRALEPFEKIRQRGRRPDGHHGRVPLDVAACCRR